jgi:hypothetical protein
MLVWVISMVMHVTKRVLFTVCPVYQKKNVHGVNKQFIMDHIVSSDARLVVSMEDAIKEIDTVLGVQI